MKKLSMQLIIMLLSMSSFAQQLPNASFENWTTSTMYGTLELDNWYSFNMITNSYPSFGTLRSTDAYDGNYALTLKSGRITTGAPYNIDDTTALLVLGVVAAYGAKDGHPFTHRPAKCSYYYKYKPGTYPSEKVDTGLVFFKFTKYTAEYGQENVGYGYQQHWGSEVTNYTKVEIPIVWLSNETPDSIFINFTSSQTGFGKSWNTGTHFGNVLGNELTIDKLEFSYTVNNIQRLNEENLFTIYPCPANDKVKINSSLKYSTDCIIYIYNSIGSTEKVITNYKPDDFIDVSNLMPGIYYIAIKDKNIKAYKQLMIHR